MYKLSKPLLGIVLLFLATASWAQDVTGRYRLDAAQDMGFDDCVWTGSLEWTQTGGNPGSFTGPGSATLISGGGFCSDFSGAANGTITGSTLDFGIAAGPLGTVVFNGTLAMDGSVSGAWAGLGVTGTWSATPVSATAVPTLPIPVLILLAGAMGGIGASRISSVSRTRKRH